MKKVVRNTKNSEVSRSSSFRLEKKIKLVKDELKKWNKEVFGNLQERKKNLELKLREAQLWLSTSISCIKEKLLRKEFEDLEEQEQIY